MSRSHRDTERRAAHKAGHEYRKEHFHAGVPMHELAEAREAANAHNAPRYGNQRKQRALLKVVERRADRRSGNDKARIQIMAELT